MAIYRLHSEVLPVNGIKHLSMVGDVYQNICASIRRIQKKIRYLSTGQSRQKLGFKLSEYIKILLKIVKMFKANSRTRSNSQNRYF